MVCFRHLLYNKYMLMCILISVFLNALLVILRKKKFC